MSPRMDPEVERLILTELERQSREIASLTAKVDLLKCPVDHSPSTALAQALEAAMNNVQITANRINEAMQGKYHLTLQHDSWFPEEHETIKLDISRDDYYELRERFVGGDDEE